MRSNDLIFSSAPLCGLTLIAALLLPHASEAATTYAVRQQPLDGYTPLPIAGGEAVVVPAWSRRVGTHVSNVEGEGSAFFALPFPVRFFGATYDGVAAKDGVLTFGTREETLCDEATTAPPSHPACASQAPRWQVAGPIPRELLFPNRLLALWWGGVGSCQIRGQTLGHAPTRTQVIQFICADNPWEHRDLVRMQAWFREDASSIEVRYDLGPEGLPTQNAHLFAGMMSPEAGGVYSAIGLSCSRLGYSCKWADYPAGTSILYTIPPDLAAVSVVVDGFASPGVPLGLRARVENIGDEDVQGVRTRFYLSASGALDGASIPLAESEAYDLQKGASIDHELLLTLPEDLGAGSYRIFVHADPLGVVDGEINLANNVVASSPFLYGASSPLLQVVGAEISDAKVQPGALIEVELVVANEGSRAAEEIPFAVVLSRDGELGPTDRLVSLGELTAAPFQELRVFRDVVLPEDLEVGRWILGAILDPFRSLPSTALGVDRAIAGELLVAQPFLRALTRALPQARIGQSYCVVLEAEGGVGSYVWAGISELPAGLALEELPAGAREAGAPFVTRLCGRPSQIGLHAFELELRSAELSIRQRYELEVVDEILALSIASTQLPVGAYRDPFYTALVANGGTPPYGWALEAGRLPQGLELGLGGAISGAPLEDGRFPLTVRVTDAVGERASQELALWITAPTHLRCVPQALPAREVGELHDERLRAAGGVRPYRWQTVETRRLADAPGEAASSSPGEPPPGLELSSLGEVKGSPAQGGRFLWTVAVSDSAQIPGRDECVLVVDVPVDRGLTVTNRNLPPAVVGARYEIQLEAQGGEGPLRWALFEGNRLPEGMSLSPSGLIEGAPTAASLEGGMEWTYFFLVEVRDDRLRRGLAPLSITVQAEAPQPRLAAAPVTSGGCQTGGGGAGWLSIGASLALAWGRIRRQRWQVLPMVVCVALALGACGDGGGGGGGDGGDRCGEQICGEGTQCNEESGRCECSRSPDSCQAFGKVCNSVGVCIEREDPQQVQPFQTCGVVGERSEDGSLLCHGPTVTGANFWAPPCETSGDCLHPTTVCLKERSGGELPICWFNFCGESEVVRDRDGAPVLGQGGELQLLNGESWGACDTVTGRLQQEGSGTCLPEVVTGGVQYLCHASGRLGPGEICAGDAANEASALCEQGLGCRVIPPPLITCWEDRDCDPSLWCNHPDPKCDRGKPDCLPTFCKARPCSTRDECGEGNFCGEGFCIKGGTCEGTCDGLAESDGAFASCEREGVPQGQTCIGNVPPDTSNLEALVAWCEEGACDVLDPESCGEDARCEPKPSPQRPLGGSCVPYGEQHLIVGEGESCGGMLTCSGGLSCKRIRVGDGFTESRCVRLCACEGGEGWDETARCKGASPQCEGEDRCTQFLNGNDVLGACL